MSRLWTVSKKDYREDDNISVKKLVEISPTLGLFPQVEILKWLE